MNGTLSQTNLRQCVRKNLNNGHLRERILRNAAKLKISISNSVHFTGGKSTWSSSNYFLQIISFLAHTWERGWGWLVLNLCDYGESFWWNSYVGSKIVRFLGKMDGPSRNLHKANFSPQKKESSVPHLVVQIHFMAPIVCLWAFTSSSLCTEACIFARYLSFYTYLILCELWMRVIIVAKLVQIFY